ncbi:zinc-ribbon domain-containing protein [Phycisphaerales bacterium AB-hyl4]|uniref:Zinc-ribbon domain-containing protein n=1 Tax=Natronomicrosphaera hydrolytica TaxID=3242702 RepID=A0ABV4U9F1_9BACT
MKVTCPNCDKSYQLADHLAGRRVKCKTCQHVFVAQAEMAAVAVPAPVSFQAESEPVKAPAGPTTTPREYYDQLPWYRKGHIMSPLVVIGLLMCGYGWIPIVVALWTGPIYHYPKLDASELREWPAWNKYVFAGVLVLVLILTFARLVDGVIHGGT